MCIQKACIIYTYIPRYNINKIKFTVRTYFTFSRGEQYFTSSLIFIHSTRHERQEVTPSIKYEISRSFMPEVSLSAALNTLRWQLVARTITSDRTAYNNSSLSSAFELVGTISLDRNYSQVIYHSFHRRYT